MQNLESNFLVLKTHILYILEKSNIPNLLTREQHSQWILKIFQSIFREFLGVFQFFSCFPLLVFFLSLIVYWQTNKIFFFKAIFQGVGTGIFCYPPNPDFFSNIYNWINSNYMNIVHMFKKNLELIFWINKIIIL